MARIRTIKPEFFTSEDIVSLTPLARLLYVALWCEADREGRLLWKPRTFKMRYFPADNCDIDALAREIIASGLVILYGDGLAFIPSFKRHQHINPRESASTITAPENDAAGARASRVGTREGPASDVQGGREGKEGDIARQDDAPPDTIPMPPRAKKPRQVPLPDGFEISERVRSWASNKGYTNLDARLEHFVSYAKRNGKTYADWDEAFMGAIREDWAKLCSKTGEADGHWSTRGLVL